MSHHSTQTHSPSAPRGKSGAAPFFSKTQTFFPQSGQGIFKKAPNYVAQGNGQAGSMQIMEGRTAANYSHSHSSRNEVVSRATGCRGCPRGRCVQITGELVSVFTTNPDIQVPSASDYPGLTPCQRRRVAHAIRTILEPHERRHETIFHTYDGTEVTPFSFQMCHSQRAFNQRLAQLHNGIERPRRRLVQQDSDAIDPFNFIVDINCED